ncbi:hypothetical protein EC988_010208, partial [Linderina pennispora]
NMEVDYNNAGRVATTEFISEFDEPRSAPVTAVRAMTAPTWSSNSLQHADRSPASSQATTAVSSPPTPTSEHSEFPVPRPRPKPARAARSAVDMQSVYFAPGRNIKTPNAAAGSSLYPSDKPQFDKNSASSMDYYVFTPTRRDAAATMPLDERKRHRAQVKADQATSALHKHELAAEASAPASLPANTNPF